MDHLELVLICTGHRALHPVLLQLKPSSSAPNNARSSNVLTPAPTHRPSCFSAPTCINRSVYSEVRTSFLWSPPVSTEQLFFGAGQVSPLSQSIQPIQPCADYCHLHFCIFFFLFVDFAESHECKDREQTCICKGVLTTHREDMYALCLHLNVVSSSVENFP